MATIILALTFFCIAGSYEGFMDVLQFKWHKCAKNFGDETFWNPQISWKNKWKKGDPYFGEKFLFSSTIFVGLTDGWHLMKLFRNWMLFFAVLLSIQAGQMWIAPCAYVINRIGFSLIYNLLYK